jgi:hypothetical protein
MNVRKLSDLQKAYRAFFWEKMRLYGVKSPAELTKENKSKFFTEIKQDWAKHKLSKKQSTKTSLPSNVEEPIQNYDTEDLPATRTRVLRQTSQETVPKATKQVIKSEPNPEQTDDLKILFIPNAHFAQERQYKYPVVKMPKPNSNLKLPRIGRSNQKGYKEHDFYKQLKLCISGVEIVNNVHLVIPNFNRPYEPDIVLVDKRLNLYVDIEIDEPYDGYYRYPTHSLNPEEEEKQDNIRDLFFTESGWIVIRFTEKQVHCQTSECIKHIQQVLNSIVNLEFDNEVRYEQEDQWDYNQCIQWQKLYYREKYLGIDRFQKQFRNREIEIDTEEIESIENIIKRTRQFDIGKWTSSIAFDEESHKYLHAKDETGNAEYVSVTTLIERFFPFDLRRYIERKAKEEGKTEDVVLDEYLILRDEAAEKGTTLHNQIENFLKGYEFDSNSKEFELFSNFHDAEIKKRSLEFSEAEKMILSNRHNVAGTIDCLFRKTGSGEYVMIDWKRSKKVTVDGRPRVYGYGFALSELDHLDNSSFNRYCLQQNIYKHILETEYSLKVSSMKLVVLHENFPSYYVLNVPDMKEETEIILNSLATKI